MTAQEVQTAGPDSGHAALLDTERWRQARELALKVAVLLRERFGADRVVVFGSVAHRTWFTRASDVDMAAWGIPPGRFYRAVAEVTGLSSDFHVDLVDGNRCPTCLRRRIESEGVAL